MLSTQRRWRRRRVTDYIRLCVAALYIFYVNDDEFWMGIRRSGGAFKRVNEKRETAGSNGGSGIIVVDEVESVYFILDVYYTRTTRIGLILDERANDFC